jgi:hypothetical protein
MKRKGRTLEEEKRKKDKEREVQDGQEGRRKKQN